MLRSQLSLGLRFSLVVAFAIVHQACSAGGTSSSSGGVEPNENDGGGGIPASNDGGADAVNAASTVVTFDGKAISGFVKSCGYSQDATYRTMTCNLELSNGNTITVSYLSGAGSGFAPTGSVNVPRQDNVLVTVQMMETGVTPYATAEDTPWSGKGTLSLTATGADGIYAGSAQGTFTRNNPFSSKPTPAPIAFEISWSKKF